MKLFLGLGNTGSNYQNTRHNVGFIFVNSLASKYSCQWHSSPKLSSQIAKPASQDILFAKPTTLMNNSGHAASALINYYKINLENFYLIHDDLDLKIGEYKINKKYPKDHKGVASVQKHLGTKEFTRIRLGIDNRDHKNRTPGDKYVLSRFKGEEQEKINNLISNIIKDQKWTA